MNGILHGVKIIDLSRLLPGPFCTQILGDLGADVIKIEEVVGGDYARWLPPVGKSESGNFLSINRNKRSMKLNLQNEKGKEIFLKLATNADVILEQFRPGVMERMGLGYEQLAEINPRLIMCAITGFGQNGPYCQKAGHDINYLSVAGILNLIGNYQGSPVVPGIQIADVGGGALWSALSIIAALYAREKTGKGQYIDVSMTDAVFTFMTAIVGSYSVDNKSPKTAANLLDGGNAWYNVYETKDKRYIAIGMLEEKFWRTFCNAIGRPDYIPIQFSPRPEQEKMIDELGKLFASKTADEWIEILAPLDACVSKVNNLEEALNDPHLKYRGMIIELDHPVEGNIKGLGFPIKFSETPYSIRIPPPTFGQHTAEILSELGYSPEAIKGLKDKGVI
jgi:crotonobetainyl-CoA:carnitine CoA-transferase CaiB-like acyl-CoA transferase